MNQFQTGIRFHWRRFPAVLLLGLLLPALASSQVKIEIDAADRGSPISRNLFGKFTEHLGRNVYQGAWAQIVVNPEFVPARLWPNQEVLTRRLEASAGTFRQETLLRDSRFGVAAHWSASEAVRGRWIEGSRRHLQEIRTGDEGGYIETGIFPPLQRVSGYLLTIKGRADRRTTIRAQIMTPEREVIGEVRVPLVSSWSSKEHSLEVRPGGHKAGDPYLLRLSFEGGVKVELDRVLLFPSDHVDGWEPEVVAFLREAKLPMLRFPGGNFVSGYHWKDGVGPLDARPALPNPAWPEMEWNHVGTDEWLRLCELTGAEPFICNNAGNGTAEEARLWVEYTNGAMNTPMGRIRAANGHPEPYGVRYWEIGNELYGPWQIGYTDGKGYAPRYGEFLEAMRAADPEIIVIANGLGKLVPAEDGEGYEPPHWNHELVSQNGKNVRSISVHPLEARNAPAGADPFEVWRELVAFADGYMEYIGKLVGEPMRAGGLKPKAAITEMQIFTRYPTLPTNKSIAEALWLGSLLHSCFRNDGLVELLTHSALLNHGGGLAKRRGVVYAEPVWWATHLYGSQPGTVPVAVRANSPEFSVEGKYLEKRNNVPYLDAAALLEPDAGSLTVFVINRHPETALTASLSLSGFSVDGAVEAEVLRANAVTMRASWEEPGKIRPETSQLTLSSGRLEHRFPALSLTRLRITGK